MKKIATAILTIFLLSFHLLSAFASFPDVTQIHPNYDAINYLQLENIVSGYPNGTFAADEKVNRAEFTKTIISSQFSKETTDNCQNDTTFPDVEKTEWYAPYVCVALENNIVSGYSDGTFGPEKNINFAEASKIIVNAFGEKISKNQDIWYKPFAILLSEKKAIPDSIDSVNKNLTRGEMAEMIYRIKENITNKPYSSFFDTENASNTITNAITTNTVTNITPYRPRLSGIDDSTAPSIPGTPSTPTPTADNTPTWTWTESSDSGAGLATSAYTLQWSQDSNFESGVSSTTSNTNSFTHTSTLADGTWYFQIMATDNVGNESSYSDNNTVVIDSTAPSSPGTPSTSTPTADNTPTWTWTASTDSGTGLATPTYTLQWSQDSNFESGVSSTTSNTNSFTHTSTLADDVWYFRIMATDTVNNDSSYSSNGTAIVYSYIIRDLFTTDAAAGSVSGAAVPGPGTRTVVDGENKLSISNGRLVLAGPKATPTWGDPGIWWDSQTRAVGLCTSFLIKPDATDTNLRAGWDSNQTGTISDSINYRSNGTISVWDADNQITGLGLSYLAIPYNVALVQRAQSFFLLTKQESASNWNLLWVGSASTTDTMFPAISNHSVSGYADDVEIHQLSGDWTTATNLATTSIASPTNGQTASGAAEGLVEFTWTPATDETMDLSVRRTDDNNRWIIRSSQTDSTINLIQISDGVETVQKTATQTWSAGTPYRIVVKLANSSIYYWVASTYKNSLSSSFNETATGLAVSGFTTGADLIQWPKTLPAPLNHTSASQSFVGWGDSKTNGDNYQNYLLTYLNTDTSYDWYQTPAEMGRPGWTVDLWKDQIDTDLAAALGVPNYILINIGANDIQQLASDIDPTTWQSNFAYILDAMHTEWPDAKIYVMRVWRRYNNGQMEDLNDVWIPVVLSTRSSWAFLGPDERIFLENGDDGITYTSDGIHPNDAGYQLTATQWESIMGF